MELNSSGIINIYRVKNKPKNHGKKYGKID